MSEVTASKPWYTAKELAERFGCSAFDIEALARRHHWPRVNREHGTLIGVDLPIIARALGSTEATVHGSLQSH
jgi:hypothetical protein